MVKIKGLQTAVGSYGTLKRGAIIEVRQSLASQLAKEGIAEIVGEDDGSDKEPEVRGGVRIKDVEGNALVGEEKVIVKETIIKPENPKPEKAESDKAEPAEVSKKEQKETPKKELTSK